MARSTADLLGFNPKDLDDDALLAALKPEAPKLPNNYFNSHNQAMKFTPSCECPTCKAAADYQAEYKKYEEQKALFATDALPPMLKKRVERIESAKTRSAYDIACAALTERGINIIPDSECTDMGTYLLWNNWTPQARIWLKSPAEVASYYETIKRHVEYYGESMASVLQQRASDNVYAHPTKKIRIKGWIENASGSRVYEHYIDSDGRQWRRDFREGQENDVNSMSTTTGRYDSLYTRKVNIPSSVRRHAMRRLLDRMRHENETMESDDYDRHSLLIESLAPNNGSRSPYMSYRGTSIISSSYMRVRTLLKRVGTISRNPSAEWVPEMISAQETIRNIIAIEFAQLLTGWNRRATSDDVRLVLSNCGHVHTVSSGHQVHRGTACSACFARDYVYVQDTGQYHQRRQVSEHFYDEDDEDEDGEPLVSGYYTYRQGSDAGESLVRNYSDNVLGYFPAATSAVPSIYGDVLMGVELEVASHEGCGRGPMVRHTHKNLCEGYAIMKNDGSLPSGGFEIVTAPRFLKEHIDRFGAWTPHEKLRAWDARTCGLHVHLSSQSFSAATLGKFLEFINKIENSSIVMAVAGRTPESDDNARRYCQREGQMIKGNPKKTLSGKSTERYRMVNTQNLSATEAKRLGLTRDHVNGKNINTVELRIFRASLKKGRLLAQIEFAHAAVMFCRQASMRELERDHFTTWLRKAAGMYPNLAKWFGVKANTMTVNDAPAICAEAEV